MRHFGYYISKKSFKDRHYVVLAIEKVNIFSSSVQPNIIIFRPCTGKHEINRSILSEKYTPATPKGAEAVWRAEHSSERTSRVLKYHILAGNVLPLWQCIETTFQLYNTGNADKKYILRVVRAMLLSQEEQGEKAGERTSTKTAAGNSRGVRRQERRGTKADAKGATEDDEVQIISPPSSPVKRRGVAIASSSTAPIDNTRLNDNNAGMKSDVTITAKKKSSEDAGNSIIGIWIPNTRIEKVIRITCFSPFVSPSNTFRFWRISQTRTRY